MPCVIPFFLAAQIPLIGGMPDLAFQREVSAEVINVSPLIGMVGRISCFIGRIALEDIGRFKMVAFFPAGVARLIPRDLILRGVIGRQIRIVLDRIGLLHFVILDNQVILHRFGTFAFQFSHAQPSFFI